jgi:hypothetical protein
MMLYFGGSRKMLCKEYLATFIINDNVHLANNWMDGVHLGLSDMSVEEARLILGKTKNHRRHCKILLKTCFKEQPKIVIILVWDHTNLQLLNNI